MKYLIIISYLVIVLFTVYSFSAENTDKISYQITPKIVGEFKDIGTNWQLDGILSLTEPVHFPYQNPHRSNTEACPVVLANGDVLLVWGSQDSLVFSRSTDGGENWQTPGLIASTSGDVADYLSGICTQAGRAIITWRDTQGFELMMSFSDDNGASWSNPRAITPFGRNERWMSLSQTLDGTLWLFYSDDVPGNARDIFYITSTNNGDNWSGEQSFLATPEPASEINGSIISADGSTLLVFYQDNSSGYSHIYQMSSTDGGQTWSVPIIIGQVYQDEFRPRALRQTDGTLWLVYGANTPTPVLGTLQNDIYYMTSSDGGSNWSVPEKFTQYVGNDGGHNIALLNDQPFVSFNSYRWANWNQYQIWYGIIGTTMDSNLPPALFSRDIISPLPNQTVTVRAHVDDESGISDVTITYTLDGVTTGPFQMYDDGNHNDGNASDNIWGTDIGPFQIGDTIVYWFNISDNSASTVEVDAGSFDMPPVHTAGNVILSVHNNSKLADETQTFGRSAYWETSEGYDYLYLGGLWVGAEVSGEQRVMNMHYNQREWTHTAGTSINIGPGISDQDIEMYYDDQSAQSAPIGLEVQQQSYQWSNPTQDDFIIFRYTITNTGLNGDLNDVYVALWLDPDITTGAVGEHGDDMGDYDYQRGLAYLYDPGQDPPGRLGIKLFGAIPHTVNIHSGGDPNDDQQRFQFMTAGYQTNATWGADWRILLTAPPFNLLAGESYTVGFGLVLGNETELLTNTDAMISLYEQVWGVSQPLPPPGNLIAIDKLDSEVALYWNDLGGSPDFNIYRKGPADPFFNQIATVPAGQNRYDDYGVANDQVYEYYVTAVYLTGESDPSDITTGYPMAVPDEPGKVVSHSRPGGRPYGIASDGSSVWMADYYFDYIRQFDPNTWQWTGQIPTPGGGGSYGLAWDGTSLWVAHLDPGTLYQIDLSGNILQFIDIQPGTATGVACENGNVWTMDRNNSVVYKYDATSGQLLQTFPFPDFQGAVPRGLAYLPDRGTFIVGVTGGSMIYEMTTTDFTFTGRSFEFNMEYDPGNDEFNSLVRGVAYNPFSGNYWIGDVRTDMIYEVLPFSDQNEIKFLVDMSVKIQQLDFQPVNGDIVVVRGSFNGWSGNNEILADANNNLIYAGVYDVGGSAGEEIQYKFVIHKADGTDIWESNPNPSNPPYGNRQFILTGYPVTLPVVYFDNDLGSGGILVTNTNDDGPGSLREAINAANNDGIPSLIAFANYLQNQTIYLQTQLESLTEDGTTIDGDINNDGLPDIEINPSADIINGLVIESAQNTINGLLINNFYGPGGPGYCGIRLTGSGSHDNSVLDCYIGTDLSTNENRMNRGGILIFEGAHNNTIGGPNPVDGNVIYFNRFGIYISGPSSYGNTITHNSIAHNSIVLINGANNGILPPTITDFDGATLWGITVPNSTVEVFSDFGGNGEEFLGDVLSDGSGNFSYSGYFPEDRFYNLTVTDPNGNTSTFSTYYRQNEINANHWRAQLVNDGCYSRDVLGGGSGGEFPKGSGIYILYGGGHYLGTMKNDVPSVSQCEWSSEYSPGKIINSTPAPIDQLSAVHPLSGNNKVFIIDSTRSGDDWNNWPVDDGAPIDANGDPLLLSPQDSWTIFNDLDSRTHSGTDQPILGLEVQRSTYSYTFPNAMADAFIVKWKITNKSTSNYTDTYFSAFFDPDVDDALNDLLGTDTTLNMIYCYNANDNDAPQAFGAYLLKGPLADGQMLGLTATFATTGSEMPQNDEERYNIQKGFDRWGNTKPFGTFDFTGDPLTNTGNLDWNPTDKETIISSGPFTFYAGNTQEIVIACIGAVGTDRLDAVAKLKETTRQVQEFYNRPTVTLSITKGISKYKTPVRISINNANGLLGADFKIQYDQSILKLSKNDIDLTPLTSDFIESVNVMQNQGEVSIALASSSPGESDLSGVLVKLPFKVKNNTSVGDISDLIFSEATLTFQNDPLTPLSPVIVDGKLEVVDGFLFGDVNQNGTYDLIDAVLILKALIEMYNEITPFEELLADANKNGKLAVNDALYVLNELVLNKSGVNSLNNSPADSTFDIKLNLQLIQGDIGRKVTVPLSTKDFKLLYGLDVAFQYDPYALRFESIENTNSTDMLVTNQQIPGQVHFAVINPDGIGNQDRELVTLVFTILKEGDHQITIEKSQGVPSWEEIAHLFIPKEFKLAQNYPNPFNPTTTIKYQLPEPEKVKLDIYNIRGQRVVTLVNEYKDAGYYSMDWNASEISSGVYFYRLQAGEFTEVKKCVFVK